MLISFTVENFRSFAAEEEISAIANARQTNLTEHLVELPGHDQKVVPIMAIYGANGAGKSNLVTALGWLWHHALRNSPTDYASGRRSRPLFVPASAPTRMEVRFLAGDAVLSYGLTALDDRFESEWFSAIRPGGRERTIFERKTTDDGTSTIEYGKDTEPLSEKLEAMKVIGALPTELFLTKVFRDIPEKELPASFMAALTWFRHLVIVEPDAPYALLEGRVASDEEFRTYLEGLLNRLGTGVDALVAESQQVPVTALSNSQRAAFEQADVGDSFARDELHAYVKLDATSATVLRLNSEHKHSSGERKALAFASESDGTRRLAHLAPAAYEASLEPFVFVVDELDRSLHAILVKAFLREFLTRARGHRNQLIFTTHETHAMDQDLLRRDEVWFVEKDQDGASHLFSLDDFPVRTDFRLDRGYLMGRFGAIPAIR